MKNKAIDKNVKKTRSQHKDSNESDPSHRRGHIQGNNGKKGNKSHNLKKKLEKIGNTTHHISESQKIVVDLNLGQYGFDSPVIENPCRKIEELVNQCELFAYNPNILKTEWRQICHNVTRILQNENYLLQAKNSNYFYTPHSEILIEIPQEQHILLDSMHELLTKIKNGSKQPGLIGAICEETQQVRQMLQILEKDLDRYREIQRRNQIQDRFLELNYEIAFKTFVMGLQVLNIDELNYFLVKEFEQNSRPGKMEGCIQNWQQWTQFIQKKRVRLRKANKFILHTACQLCLSGYSEKANPITNCPECHIRGHRLCLGPERTNRCGRCIYLRLSNQVKQKIPECYICNVRYLAPMKVAANKFAHAFCLLATQQWKMSSASCIEYSPPPHQQPLQPKPSPHACKYCTKKSPHTAQCRRCQSYSHHMCAFMNGATFTCDHEQYTITLACCQLDRGQADSLGEHRKYVLNYNNVVFKKLAHILRSNKKSRRRRGAGQDIMVDLMEMGQEEEIGNDHEMEEEGERDGQGDGDMGNNNANLNRIFNDDQSQGQWRVRDGLPDSGQ